MGCIVLLAAGVLVVAAAGMNPAPLAALAGSLACLAGVLVIAFQGVGNWAAASEYSLPGKNLVLLLVLVIAATALGFWSTSL